MRMRKLLMLITSGLSCNSTIFIIKFMGQYLKGNNMATKKIIMADMRMRKFLTFITPI